MKTKRVFLFEIIMNKLVGSSRYIWILYLCYRSSTIVTMMSMVKLDLQLLHLSFIFISFEAENAEKSTSLKRMLKAMTVYR